MHPEIEKLIDFAIADEQITEKERNVILKKATELGDDLDEVEMILEGKFHQVAANKPKDKVKVGNISICPACGATVKAMIITCSACGHEFSNTNSNKSISKLLNELNNLKKESEEEDWDFERRKADLINHTPIPINREDLIEFLSTCCSQADVDFMARGSGNIPSAWANKGNEALLKAKIAFNDDPTTKILLNDFEKKLNNASRKSKMIWVLFLFVFAILGGIISLIEYFDK
jgi:hypothetical protein